MQAAVEVLGEPNKFSLRDQAKYDQLRMVDREADMIFTAINNPLIRHGLAQMPDLKCLLETFKEYLTVKSFLEENFVPHNSTDIAKFNFNIRDYLFGNKFSAIAPLLRRATFSRWIYRHTDWYEGDQDEIARKFNASAQFVYSTTPPREQKYKANRLRRFLDGVVTGEFAIAAQEIEDGYSYTFDDLFASRSGRNITGVEDVDFAGTFGLFADSFYIPAVFIDLAKEYIQEPNHRKSTELLAAKICMDDYYTIEYKTRWIYEGLHFLENALIMKYKASPTWGIVTFERRRALSEFRKLFQGALNVF